MEAKLVYHYSLNRAFDDGILRPVEFFGVSSGLNVNESDSILIDAAKKALSEQKKISLASIMIITDRFQHAKALLE